MAPVFKKLADLVKRQSSAAYFNGDWSGSFARDIDDQAQRCGARDHAAFDPTVVYGNSSEVSAVDYDPIQGMLAVGTTHATASVKLYGRELLTAVLKPKDNRPATVKFLRFRPGLPVLISVDSENTLTLFDLKACREFFTHSARNTVTCIELLHATDWLLVGFADGTIDVYDASRGWRSPYTILDQHGLVRGIRVPKQIPEVVAMAAQPGRLGKLLIGYSTGLIVLWNFITRSQAMSFFPLDIPFNNPMAPNEPPSPPFHPRLTALAFHPGGTNFATGYEDGYLAFWDAAKDQGGFPLAVLTVHQSEALATPAAEPANPVILSPIFRLSWCSITSGAPGGATRLVVAGGTNLATQPSPALHILDFEARKKFTAPQNVHNLVPPRSPYPATNSSRVADDVPPPVSDFLLLPASLPWRPVYDPVGICIIINGQLRMFRFPAWSKAAKKATADFVCLEDTDIPSDLRLGQRVAYSYLVSDIQTTARTGETMPPGREIVNANDQWDTALIRESKRTADVSQTEFKTKEEDQQSVAAGDFSSAEVKSILFTIHSPDNTLCAWEASGGDEGRGLGKLIGSIHRSELATESIFDDQNTEVDQFVTPTIIQYLRGESDRLAVGYSNGTVLVFDATFYAERSTNAVSRAALAEDQAVTHDDVEPGAQGLLPAVSPKGKEVEVVTTADKPLPAPPPGNAAALEHEPKVDLGSAGGVTVRVFKHPDGLGAYQRALRLHSAVQHLPQCPRLLDHAGGVLLAIGCAEGAVIVVNLESGDVVCFVDVNLADRPESSGSASSLRSPVGQTPGSSVPDAPSSIRFVKSVLDDKDLVPRVRLLVGTERGRNIIYTFARQNGGTGGRWICNEETSFRLSEPEPILYLAVMDANGNEAAPVLEPSAACSPLHGKENLAKPHLFITASPRTVRGNLNCSATRIYKTTLTKPSGGEERTVLVAGIARRNGSTALLCLGVDNTVIVLRLPTLEFLREVQLTMVRKGGLQVAQVLPSGQVLATVAPCEYGLFDPFGHSSADTRWARLYDEGRPCPANPTFASGGGGSFGGGILGFFGFGGDTEPSEAEMDELLGGASRPRPKVPLKQQPSSPHRLPEQPTSAAGGAASGSAFAQARAGLDERGEKLSELSKKLGGMEDASKDFLASVREYNARQANKKWYEF